MNNYKLQIGFFTVLITGALLLSYSIIKPFLAALFIAIILRIVFNSFHVGVLRFTGGRETLAALLSLASVIVFILVPVALIGFFLFSDVRDLYVKIIAGNFDAHFIDHLTAPVYTFIQRFDPSFSFDIVQYFEQVLGLVLGNIGVIFSSIAIFLFDVFLMLLALFYLFLEGARLRKDVIILSPLSDNYDENILTKLANAVSSVIRGSLLVACIKGILSAIGFFAFGVPNPILWAALAAITSLVPPVGVLFVLVPAIIYLFWSGMTFSAWGLIIWGGAVIMGLSDNFVAPRLMARGLKVHSFIILLSVLGGLWFFGPIGFLAGPVVVTLLLTLLEMYPAIVAGGSVSKKLVE